MLNSVNGINISLRCSQTLSFTGAIIPTIALFPERSYAKCKKTPSRIEITHAIIIIFL